MRQRPSLVYSTAAASRSGPSGAAKCAADNGGLTLAEGFCASVFTNDVGPVRHIAVAPNGDLYAATSGRFLRGSVTGLRDQDGDGVPEQRESFGPRGVNDVAVHDGYLYLALRDRVMRMATAWSPRPPPRRSWPACRTMVIMRRRRSPSPAGT
jgi:hypothetical protein